MLLSCKVLGLKWSCGCKYPKLKVGDKICDLGGVRPAAYYFFVSHLKSKTLYIICILDFHVQKKCFCFFCFFNGNMVPPPKEKKHLVLEVYDFFFLILCIKPENWEEDDGYIFEKHTKTCTFFCKYVVFSSLMRNVFQNELDFFFILF